MDISDPVIIKKRYRHSLDVPEGRIPQVFVYAVLHPVRVKRCLSVYHYLQSQYSHICPHKERQAVQRPARYKMLYHIPVKKRICNICCAVQDRSSHYHQHRFAVRPQYCKHFFESLLWHRFLFLLFYFSHGLLTIFQIQCSYF